MADDKELIQLVKSVYLFSELPPKTVKQVVKAAKLVEHADRKVILREGDTGYGMHIVVEGTAQVSVAGEPKAILGRGSYFGELALIDGRPRTATVTAAGPLRTLALAQPAFRVFLREPSVALRMMAGLTGRLREAQDALTHGH
jgi:CRP-like cAMP-binding protein